MSPEQAAGSRELDARTDVYSLGCVLYEMLAGEPPFTGPTAQAIMARHAVDPVPPLRTIRSTISPALEAVVGKALAKVPADRFGTALEFKEALHRAGLAPATTRPRSSRRRLAIGLAAVVLGVGVVAGALAGLPGSPFGAGTGEGSIRSLAVQSFENLTGDSGQVYLAKGITDQLETELAQIGSLRVIGLDQVSGPTAAFEAARGLGLEAVLSGSLQRAGSAIRITARLKSTETGQAIWARSFDGQLSTILQLQADVARAVAERIRVSLTPGERSRIAGSRPQVTPAAYEAYVRGAYFLDKATEPSFRTAIGYFAEGHRRRPHLRRGLCRPGGMLCQSRLFRRPGPGGRLPASPSGGG